MPRLTALAGPLFVVLWSTGFIGAKYGLPYVEPLTFLAIRFGLVTALFGLWVLATGAALPSLAQARDAAVIGALMHGVYLGGVFWAIDIGIEAGVSALIVGLQPVLTALLAARLLGERLSGVQWLGMALGFLGVGLVVGHKLGGGLGDWRGLGLCLVALVAFAVAALLQKTRAAAHPMPGAMVVQFAAATVVTGAGALAWEGRVVVWSGELVFALVWLIGVLSFGAILLLYRLIRTGAAAEVASLLFLVPPVTVLIAWPLFGEAFGPLELAGVVAAACGVLLVNRPHVLGRR